LTARPVPPRRAVLR